MDKLNLLLVDDELDLLDVYEDFLKDSFENLKTVKCVNVATARQALNEQNFQLIISDYKMPKEDGLVLLKYCREQVKGGANLPFIMISGYKEDIVNTFGSDSNFYLLDKPINLEKLTVRIKELLKL